MSLIRVMHVVGKMNRGGMESFIMNVYRQIDRNKVQFDFAVHTKEECDFDKEIQKLGGHIYFITPKTVSTKKNFIDLKSVFSGRLIVHIHTSAATSLIDLYAAKSAGVKTIIIHSHNTHAEHPWVHYIMRPFISWFSDYYFACSEDAGHWMYTKKTLNSEKFKIISNAINVNEFTYDATLRKSAREKFNVEKKFLLGHVGRFHFQKNHMFLLDIFKAVHDRNKDSVLLLVGDGELRPQIEAKIADLDLIDSVILTGVRADTAELYQAMDVFVFPSLFEGLGIVAIEAQAAGLPCIVANTIPREAFVTDLIRSVPLEETPEVWATEILKCKERFERKDTSEQVRQAGYDIKEQAKWLEKFYIKGSLKSWKR